MIIDNQLLDQVSGQAKESERLRMNFNLHETLDAKAQRLLNALEVGTVLPIHRHRHTAETYILLRGHINVMFYNADGERWSAMNCIPEMEFMGFIFRKGSGILWKFWNLPLYLK